MTSKIIILDGDEIAYNCACVGEKRSIIATHNPSGREKEFKNRTEFRTFIKGKFDEELFTIKDVQNATDFSFVRKLIKEHTEKVLGALNADGFEIYLSGDNNFRLDLPKPVRYKSNRLFVVRPVHLQAAKKYLESMGARVVHGREADDVLAERMFDGYTSGQKIVGCTVDKDARMNLGWLVNPDKLSEGERFIDGLGSIEYDKGKITAYGRFQLYTQLLIGDPTDCYCPREWLQEKTLYGPAKAFKSLNGCTTDAEAIAKVIEQYRAWYPSEVVFKDFSGVEHTFTWKDILQVIADCAYMRRSVNDRWDVKKILEALNYE